MYKEYYEANKSEIIKQLQHNDFGFAGIGPADIGSAGDRS